MIKSTYILGIILVAIIAVLIGISVWPVTPPANSPVALPPVISTTTTAEVCTQDAKECPNGSYVARTGPQCSFAVCPTHVTQGSGVLQGTMTIGPICPVERIDHPCSPTPEMYAAHPIHVYNADKSKLIKTLTPDAQGKFSATFPTATYIVDVEHQAVGGVRGAPATVHITNGKTVTVSIDIDTGIR